MSGVTSLVDTLLATRLAQRADLVPLKSQAAIPGPEAVAGVEKITNDVRLPSRAALEQRLDLGLPDDSDDGATPLPAAGRVTTFSTVARAIGALLGPPDDTGSKLRLHSLQALWPSAQPPLANLLAARLADAVAISGLFYESHLHQFAAGTRPLEQLVREPQAGLAPADPPAATQENNRPMLSAGASLGAGDTPSSGALTAPDEIHGKPVHGATVYDRDGNTARTMGFHEVAGHEPGAPVVPASGRSAVSDPVGATIHPDAMALVRQQLELLDVPVFRWSGEAWPGASLDWEIHEAPQERGGGGSEEATQSAWTTHLALTLPSLRSLQLRLTLAGDALQLRLTAAQELAMPVLDAGRKALSERLGQRGLRLISVQIDTEVGADATDQPFSHDPSPIAQVQP